jgi:hypothetical protein
VFAHGRVTRFEIAASTGISRPTISESVRRLTQAGLLIETGSRTTGRRGRVATFHELAPGAGYVAAVAIDQSGVSVRAADLAGQVFDERHRPPTPAGDTRALTGELRAAVGATIAAGDGRNGVLRALVLSVANPVDPHTHEIVALPDSPFPEGLVRPGDVLADLVSAPLYVDNDATSPRWPNGGSAPPATPRPSRTCTSAPGSGWVSTSPTSRYGECTASPARSGT